MLVVDHFVESWADLLQILEGFNEALRELAFVADRLGDAFWIYLPSFALELSEPVMRYVCF